MINSWDVYYDAGFKAGKAVKVQDWSNYKEWDRWFKAAKSLEKCAASKRAQSAWDEGYHAGRNL